MIYVWSDTHFNHAGILRHCATTRPYRDVLTMNASLIARWNAAVSPKDTVYLLGDFAFKAKGGNDIEFIFSQLNGRKNLLKGNHDEQNPAVLKLPWESVSDLVTLREEGVRAVACHYPLETWKSAHKGYLMLHGHSHGTLKRRIPHRFDVGADVYDNPQALQVLARIAERQTFEPARPSWRPVSDDPYPSGSEGSDSDRGRDLEGDPAIPRSLSKGSPSMARQFGSREGVVHAQVRWRDP